MEYSVELTKLPDEVRFSERLSQRIRFDAAHQRLVFQGFMTKCTYDELNTLTDDAAYHRALEDLFVLTSAEVSPASTKRRASGAIALAAIGLGALVLVMLWVALRPSTASGPASVPADVRLSTVAS